MNTKTPEPQVGVKIYENKKNGQLSGRITFYGDTIKKCNFNLFPYVKLFGMGKKLYLDQLDATPEKGKGYPIQKNGTVNFGGKNLCESMRKYEGKFFLLHDDGEHSYYIDTEESKVGDKPNKAKGGRPRKVQEVPAAIREKTKELFGEKFINPVQPAKDALKEIVVEANSKEEAKEVVEKTFFEQVNEMFSEKKPTKPEPVKAKVNTAESFVINTLRELGDECIDNDDLAGAKAILKAIRKFSEMKER